MTQTFLECGTITIHLAVLLYLQRLPLGEANWKPRCSKTRMTFWEPRR